LLAEIVITALHNRHCEGKEKRLDRFPDAFEITWPIDAISDPAAGEKPPPKQATLQCKSVGGKTLTTAELS